MTEVTKAETIKTEPLGEWALWVGLLLPPATWLLQLQTVWLTSEYGCAYSRFVYNHIASAAALVLSLIGLFIAWRCWRSEGEGTEDEGGNPLSRKRFMAMIGTAGGVLFTLVIIATWLPTILEVPCEK